MRRTGFIPVVILALATACTPPASNSRTSAPIILTSTTFLADIARNVTGDVAKVESLVPVGADPHSYQPTPQDVARLSDADVIIVNGAEYDRFLDPLIESSGEKAQLIVASTGIPVREDAGGDHAVDPHLWLDPNNVIAYVKNIRDGLSKFDAKNASTYAADAEAYIRQLGELDAWIIQHTSQIPADKRLLVTNHAALGYFADRYGFSVVGAVVPSLSSDAAPSAQDMAALIDQIKVTGAPAIFLDAADNPGLAHQIAQETGVKVVDDLYLESLTDGAPAATYIDMMKHNVTRIIDALK